MGLLIIRIDKMKTITIQPKKDGYTVKEYETKDNRDDFEQQPHPFGFYHYPDNIKGKTAFNRLKKVMILHKETLIENLKQEIKELKGIKYENN
jgi:hypothetical protein